MLTGQARDLIEYIKRYCYGQENARPIPRIARDLGLDPRRVYQLRKECNRARIPIFGSCASIVGNGDPDRERGIRQGKGLFYAWRFEEFEHKEHEQESRIGQEAEYLRLVREMKAKRFGEMPLFAAGR